MSAEAKFLALLHHRSTNRELRAAIRETMAGRKPAALPTLASRGGIDRAAVLSPERRQEIARLGGLAAQRRRRGES